MWQISWSAHNTGWPVYSTQLIVVSCPTLLLIGWNKIKIFIFSVWNLCFLVRVRNYIIINAARCIVCVTGDVCNGKGCRMDGQTHTHTHTHMHTCTCTHMCIHTHTHVRMHTRTHVRAHIHTHTHTHTHGRACMHTHTHTHMDAHAHTYAHYTMSDASQKCQPITLFLLCTKNSFTKGSLFKIDKTIALCAVMHIWR